MLRTTLTKLLYVAVPLAIGVSAWLQIILLPEGDKGWLLHATQMWLEGGRLYVNIVEVNPPLIFWLYAVPVWLSLKLSWLTASEALGSIGVLCCMISVSLGTWLIRFHPAFAGNTSRQIRFAALLALIFVFYTTQAYFFDRDHIFIVFTFPYMLRFMPGLQGEKIPRLLRILVACLAAVGFCIKPHTVIAFAAIQLFVFWRTRTFRALVNQENITVVLAGLLYGFAVWIFTPEYFRIILPMALETYSDFGNFASRSAYLPVFFMAMILMFVDFRIWDSTPYRRDVFYFAGLCFVLLAYALANNGWGYTYNPLYCMLVMTSGWMIWDYNCLRLQFQKQGMPSRRAYLGMRGCITVMLVQAAYMVFYFFLMSTGAKDMGPACLKNPECLKTVPALKYMTEHDVHSFGTISFDFSNWVALLNFSDIHWVTRFNHMWMLTHMLYDGARFRPQHRWITEFVARGLADDLDGKKPEVVLVDVSAGVMGRPRDYDFIPLLSDITEFRQAWGHYSYAETLDYCKIFAAHYASGCKYDVYRRAS